MWWRFFIVLISFVLIGAHYLRSGHYIITLISLIIPFLLFFKSTIINVIIERGLYILAFTVWGWSGFNFIMERINQDQSWVRLFIIMFIVFLYTIFSGLCINQLNKKILEKS